MTDLEKSRAERRGMTRGKRVEYVGTMTPRFNGEQGTITNAGDRRGWIRVRFDLQPKREPGERVAAFNLRIIKP